MTARRIAAALAVGIALFALSSCARPAGTPASAPASPDGALRARLERRFAANDTDLVAFRRDVHRHPEVSGEESRTAGLVAARLRKAGLAVRTGIGGHGVVATLRGGRPGPRVAVRADMDAVRTGEPDPVEFRSLDPGKRHICGHDVHTTIALGVAEALAAERAGVAGTVVFVFQPAEETATGARAMLDDGAFADGVPVAIFALHTAPLEVGQVASKPGVMLAGRDAFTITLHGPGAGTEDAAHRIVAAANALATLAPAESRISTVAPFRVPEDVRARPGIAAGTWMVTGRIAVSTDSLSRDAESRLRAATAKLAADGVTGTVDYVRRDIPGIDNDAALEARARTVMRGVVGDSAFIAVRGVVPAFSEDFGAFQAVAPGVLFWLGVSNREKGMRGAPHAPDYVADEGAIGVGERVMCALVLDALAR